MNKLLLLLLFFSALIIGCTSKSMDTQQPTSPSYQIAYNIAMNEKQTDYDVWTMNLDGSSNTNLTYNPDVAWTYLAATNKIFFISDRDTCHRCFYLYEMTHEGKNVRKITNFKLRDSWMASRKEGSELIVNPHPSVDSVFYIIDLQGNILKKLATGLAFNNNPCFSPDGSQIVFVGATKRSKREEGFDAELYLINEDGSGLKKLTHYPPADTTAPWYAYKTGPPRWNAAENFITYQSMQNGKYSLYAVTPDGAKQWKLTDNPQEEGWHDWSPDGKWLAIEIFDAEHTQFHIGLMNWESKKLEVLTDTAFVYQQAPVFLMKE